jgi:hypothetical protein
VSTTEKGQIRGEGEGWIGHCLRFGRGNCRERKIWYNCPRLWGRIPSRNIVVQTKGM